jgi:Leucine-rich repeat (LRR) protein
MEHLKILLTRVFFLFLCHAFSVLPAQPSRPQYGQIRVPVFRSPQDSLKLIEVQEKIDEELARKKFRQQKIDSLMLVQSKIYSEAIIYKMIYRPSREYIVTDSLQGRTDFTGITQVCIYAKKEIPEILWKCKDLEALELVNTQIKKLPRKLRALAHLKTVHIYRNHISEPLRLSGNKTITSLIILNETPEGLPRSYKKLRALKRLDLAENGITRFPNGSRHNKKLTELSLQRNLLTLNDKIKSHPYLERLALHGNLIDDVPVSIRQFSHLKKLNLNLNKIRTVHDALGSLSKLEQLSFYGNELTAIPEAVYRLRALKEIDLFHNQIEQLDRGFVNWQSLTTLYLSHNKLVSLPEDIDTLQSLEGLYVWDNRLGALPESVGNLKRLKYLRANNNYLKNIPGSILSLQHLEELDLSHNFIAELPEAIFDFPHLKILALVNNPWNENTWKFMPRKAKELKSKDIFVHISDEQQ